MPKEYNTPHTPDDPEYSLGGRTHTAVEDTGNWKDYINNMVMAAWGQGPQQCRVLVSHYRLHVRLQLLANRVPSAS